MKLKTKTILITGANGCIGSYLTEALVKEGAKVRGLSYYKFLMSVDTFSLWR
jgi:nucleoside-diphosphate-sugar epimerase